MSYRIYFVAFVLAISGLAVYGHMTAQPAEADAGESVGKIKAGRPDGVPKYTKRDVDEATDTRLCDMVGARTCTVINHTDKDLCLKAVAGTTCGTINCTDDNDILLVKAGEVWTDVIRGDDDAVTSTLCGRMESGPTGDCALTELGCIYTSELK